MNTQPATSKNLLEVLMYLFETHMQENCEININQELLTNELQRAGFQDEAIDKALNWLANLSKQHKITHSCPPQKTSTRIFNKVECKKIETESRGFLMRLELMDILTPATRELVISQLMQLDKQPVNINHVKWVTLMVLFHQNDQKNALLCMEYLVLNDNEGMAQ